MNWSGTGLLNVIIGNESVLTFSSSIRSLAVTCARVGDDI
jgi:hypothetical protein